MSQEDICWYLNNLLILKVWTVINFICLISRKIKLMSDFLERSPGLNIKRQTGRPLLTQPQIDSCHLPVYWQTEWRLCVCCSICFTLISRISEIHKLSAQTWAQLSPRIDFMIPCLPTSHISGTFVLEKWSGTLFPRVSRITQIWIFIV